ncbi:hypothetical protein AB0P17_11605 [Streptomyces sp. NPDC088124]|uniref:hypothetical protein n=1 Tax=Streptomyces sp. NPDC088124 TaxID=3154654 RepID=UPI00342EBA7C
MAKTLTGETDHGKIVKRDRGGRTQNIEIEVDSTEKLRAVFDDALSNVTDEGAYFVTINCSSGGHRNCRQSARQRPLRDRKDGGDQDRS